MVGTRSTASQSFSISRAFTLVELLTVIAIISILAAVALPVVNAFKPNVMAAATRQLLDDIARARQLALSQRTTVFMVFVPTNYWNDPAYSVRLAGLPAPPVGTLSERAKADKLLDRQMVGYTFVTLRGLGDQPGQNSPRYLSSWRTLPEGAFIPLQKFGSPYKPSLVIYTNGSTLPAYQINPFNITNNIPFPSEDVVNYAGVSPYVPLPYIAFNYMGQLISGQDELIPLAKGTIGFSRNPDKTPRFAVPSITESPPGNLTNAYNIVKIEWLTGRAHVERLEVR